MGRKKTYDEMSKNEIIKKEKLKLSQIWKQMDVKTQKATESLIDEAAFMAASLYELRALINKKGYTETYQNGANQKGVKKASEVEVYNAMIKNYQSTVKQLTDLLPKGEKAFAQKVTDGFDDFLKERD